MTRIQPECFIEVWKSGSLIMPYVKPIPMKMLLPELSNTLYMKQNKTIALFLIKPTNIPLAERLEARKVYQQNNVK